MASGKVGQASPAPEDLKLTLSNNEMALMTGFGLQIGGANCGNQLVSGVTAAASNGIAEVISLMAIRDDASVSFVASRHILCVSLH